jgi:hypothetical protein
MQSGGGRGERGGERNNNSRESGSIGHPSNH